MKEINIKVGVGNKEFADGMKKVEELNECLQKANNIVRELEDMGIKATFDVPTAYSVYISANCGTIGTL